MEEYSFHKNFLWQHNEIHFDIRKNRVEMRGGEHVIATIENVEDTKGNTGESGTLLFTNLRIIWYLNKNYQVNISVGYDTILNVSERLESSKVVGDRKFIELSCKKNEKRYEFVFSTFDTATEDVVQLHESVRRDFEKDRFYRDVKLKGTFIENQKLQMLKRETIQAKVGEVYNLSFDKAIQGMMILTNIRLLWISSNNSEVGFSIPLCQIKDIKSHNELIIYVGKGVNCSELTFKLEDSDFIQKMVSLIEIAGEEGIFSPHQVSQAPVFANMEIKANNDNDEGIYMGGNTGFYVTSGNDKKNTEADIEYNTTLGLAIEKLPEGKTVESFWKVI